MVRVFGSVILASVLAATAASAQPLRPVVVTPAPTGAYQTVSLGSVDFQNRQDVSAFYQRLRGAARNVCEDDSVLAPSAYFNCIDAAIADAVQTVNRPALTAYADQHDETLRTAAAN